LNRIALSPALFAVFLFSVVGNSLAQTSAPTIDTVFTLMDSAAKDFHSLTADIEHIKYTAVVKDTSTETGQISVRKDGKMRIDFKSPDPRTILRNGDSLYIYTPKISRVEEYNLGKNRAMADQYLALGFGTKSDTLKKTYEVSMIGEEEFDGKKTVLLQLIPKAESVRAQLTKIQMWVDESSWLPLQQKFFETGSGDYFLSHYTNVMKNLKINDARFKPNWPKEVKVEKPRG
jgi:outer membrane lipoprotein-sorting protein